MSVIGKIAFYFWLIWTWTFVGWQLFGSRRDWFQYKFLVETKLLFKITIVVKMASYDLQQGTKWIPFLWVLDLLWLWIIRQLDDDDRWKKRRKKAAAKVKEVAGRLVVVPEVAPVTAK